MEKLWSLMSEGPYLILHWLPISEEALYGSHEEATEYALKHVLAFQLAKTIQEQGISKMKVAKRLETNHSQPDPLPRTQKKTGVPPDAFAHRKGHVANFACGTGVKLVPHLFPVSAQVTKT